MADHRRNICAGTALSVLCGLAVLAPFGAAPALAQGAAVDGAQVEDIIVTARRFDEKLQDTPVSVSAVTGNMLARQSITNVTQLGSIAPNLSMTTFPGDRTVPVFNIRGQVNTNSSIGIDPAVSLYADDVYIARTAGNVTSLVDIDRVEVLRGPQGTLFGRNSTGGAIAIHTKQPVLDRIEGSAEIRVGNYDLREVTGVLNVPLVQDAIAVRIVGRRSERDGYFRDYYGNDLDFDHSTYLRGAVRLAPAGQPWNLTLAGDYTLFKGGGQPAKLLYANPAGLAAPLTNFSRSVVAGCSNGTFTASGCPTGVAANDTLENYIGGPFRDTGVAGVSAAFGIPGRFEDMFAYVKTYGFSANAEYDLGAVTLKSVTAWRKMQRNQSSDIDGTPYGILHGAQTQGQHQFSEELQMLGRVFDDRLTWTAGLFYFDEKAREDSSTLTLLPLSGLASPIGGNFGPARNRSYAIYGQATYKLTDRLNVTAGLRNTWEKRSLANSRFNENVYTGVRSCLYDASVVLDPGVFCLASREKKFNYLSYTAGLDFKPTDAIMAYIRTDRASRAGGFNRGPTNEAGLRAFLPERVTNYEAGVKADLFDRRLRANLAVFYSDLRNLQRNVNSTVTLPNGTQTTFTQTINAAKGDLKGLELELTARVTPRLTLDGSVGLLDASYKSFFDIDNTVRPVRVVSRAGEPFPLTPKRTFSLGGNYAVPLAGGKLDFSLDYDYRTKTVSSAGYPVSTQAVIPGYGVLNGQIKLTLENGIEASLWSHNLANKHYYDRTLDTTQSALGLVVGYPGAPRTFGATLGYKFGS